MFFDLGEEQIYQYSIVSLDIKQNLGTKKQIPWAGKITLRNGQPYLWIEKIIPQKGETEGDI